MIDDICYYDFNYLNTYKTKWIKNLIMYVVYLIMFVVVNIIFYFIENDVLYGVSIVALWFLFLNLTLIYFRTKIIRYKNIYNFYNLLYFGNKRYQILKFIKKNDTLLVKNDLEFISYIFVDNEDNENIILIEKLMGMSKSLHASKNFCSSWPFHILMIKPTVVTSLVYPPMRIYLNRSI